MLNSKTNLFDLILFDITNKTGNVGKSNEENMVKFTSELFASFLSYINENCDIEFQTIVKILVLFIFIKKDFIITETTIVFQSEDDRRRLLFIEIVAFSDILFNNRSLKNCFSHNMKGNR